MQDRKRVKVIDIANNGVDLFAVELVTGNYYFIRPPEKDPGDYFGMLLKQLEKGRSPFVDIYPETKGKGGTLVTPRDYSSISKVDLYGIIWPVKKAHFDQFGVVDEHGYEKRLRALREKRPQGILKASETSRQVVSRLLSRPCFMNIQEYGSDVKDSLSRLYKGGLLDYGENWDNGETYWCFNSEFCRSMQRGSIRAIFEPNDLLRETLTEIL